MPEKLSCEVRPKTFFRYETNGDGTFHLWACIADNKSFAVHVWARKQPNAGLDLREWFGGVEQHASPECFGQPVDSKDCAILGGNCCHDGSSERFYFEYNRVEQAIKSGRPSDFFPKIALIFNERWDMMHEKND